MKGKWLLVLLGVVVVLSLVMPGCTPDSAYDRALRSPTGLPLRNENLVCQDPGPHYTVRRGQSVELMNPCPVHPGGIIDGAWQDLSFGRDDFLISDCTGPFLPAPVNGISVNTMFGSPTKRSASGGGAPVVSCARMKLSSPKSAPKASVGSWDQNDSTIWLAWVASAMRFRSANGLTSMVVVMRASTASIMRSCSGSGWGICERSAPCSSRMARNRSNMLRRNAVR